MLELWLRIRCEGKIKIGKNMASSQKTIQKAKLAKDLFNGGNGRSMLVIAKQLKVSVARVKEYLERNDHSFSCPVMGVE